MPFEQEIRTYNENLPTLLEHMGKFVLIHKDQIVRIFTAYEDAMQEGYQEFGLDPFFVKRIESAGQIHFVSRI